MKTTIDISDPLLRDAKKLAARRGVTLRALVERGLRQVVHEAKARPPFRLRDAGFEGRGLQPGVKDADWGMLRSMAYAGRGS